MLVGDVEVDGDLETNEKLKDVDKNENDEPVLSEHDVFLKQKPKKRCHVITYHFH